MKKIFWTTIVRLIIVTAFRAYARFFDANLGNKVAPLFFKGLPVQTGALSDQTLATPVFDTLTTLTTQLDIAANKITELKTQEAESTSSQILVTSTPTVVKLYYFNDKEDKLLPVAQQANPESLTPIFRTIPSTNNIIQDTMSLLLQGALTDNEVKDGLSSSFVRTIRLVDTKLGTDGTLDLTFTKAPGASIGGSAFIGILTNSLTKTAFQFPQVKRVNLLPEELFQP